MIYQPQPNDTLKTIATALTLSPAYSVAIANLNGIYGDVTDAGETIPYGEDKPIAWFGALTIPDDWLKPGAQLMTPPASDNQRLLIWAALGVAALAVLS